VGLWPVPRCAVSKQQSLHRLQRRDGAPRLLWNESAQPQELHHRPAGPPGQCWNTGCASSLSLRLPSRQPTRGQSGSSSVGVLLCAGYVHSGFLEALGLRHIDEEEEEEAVRQYRQEWSQRSLHHHRLSSSLPSLPFSSSSSPWLSSSSSSSSSRLHQNMKKSLTRGRRRLSMTLPLVMRRDHHRPYSPAKLLRAIPALPSSLWSLMRLLANWHRRQLLRITGALSTFSSPRLLSIQRALTCYVGRTARLP